MTSRTDTTAELEKRWQKYVALLRERGVPEQEITDILQRMAHEDAELKAGRCPKCGAPSREYIDGSRRGARRSFGPGAWIQYRCSTQAPPGQVQPPDACRFMLDRYEGRGAN